MSVWLTIPVAEPREEALPRLKLWRDKGYKLAIFRDAGAEPVDANIEIHDRYQGYPKAVNALCRLVLRQHPDTRWCVAGGLDVDPDPNHTADQIAAMCDERFPDTFGVMEPTGDRWLVMAGMCAAERVCVAPWMGREAIRRLEGGNGPYCEAMFHFFSDERLREVAMNLGILWHNPALKHYHHHWTREGRERPPHLSEAKLRWDESKAQFNTMKRKGFPGHEPLPA